MRELVDGQMLISALSGIRGSLRLACTIGRLRHMYNRLLPDAIMCFLSFERMVRLLSRVVRFFEVELVA